MKLFQVSTSAHWAAVRSLTFLVGGGRMLNPSPASGTVERARTAA
jgi:hypothetical protein